MKITTTNSRFAVRCTTREGRVYMKDRISGHWTTSKVADMTYAQAVAVYEQELAKRTTSTYEILDLDIEECLVKIGSEAAKAVRERRGYDEMDFRVRMAADGIGAEIRREAVMAAQLAKQKAMMDYAVSLLNK